MLDSRVLTISQIRACENKYIKKYSLNKLINLASKKIAEFLRKNYENKKILFICGYGNNGKDGELAFKKILTKTKSSIITLKKNKKIDEKQIRLLIQKTDVIIDCIFGIGLNRDIKGDLENLIIIINNSNKYVVSVDIPSGLNGDSGKIMGICVKANLTLAIGFYKPGHFILPGKSFSGKVCRLSINLNPNNEIKPRITLLNKSYFNMRFPSFGAEVHKYNKGHVAVIGGEMAGASRLVAFAARKVGCGISTILVEKKYFGFYSKSEPGTIIQNFSLESLKNKDALVIGPGLGKKFNQNKVLKIISAFHGPIIVDADAISIFKDNKDSFLNILKSKQNIILTPHEGEFKRIFNDNSSLSKIQKCYNASQKINNCVILKGNDSVVSFHDHNIWINNLAENKLATAGSGDLLCGILAGLLAQKMELSYAVVASIWMHSMVSKPRANVVVEDFLNELPKIIDFIKKK